MNPRTHHLHDALLRHVLLGAVPPPTRGFDSHFKQKLIQAYKCEFMAATTPSSSSVGRKNKNNKKQYKVRCMLLNTALPSELVEPVHLCRRSCAFLVDEFMGFDDIDDVKNGLLLFLPLKQAFEQFRVCFIYDQSSDEFRLKVFDPALRSQRLIDRLDSHHREKLNDSQALQAGIGAKGVGGTVEAAFDPSTTFGNLDGRALFFGTLERPFKHCVYLHAELTRINAVEERWIAPDEARIPDFSSEGMSVEEKMRLFFSHEQ